MAVVEHHPETVQPMDNRASEVMPDVMSSMF
jgi:hypothetical protein